MWLVLHIHLFELNSTLTYHEIAFSLIFSLHWEISILKQPLDRRHKIVCLENAFNCI